MLERGGRVSALILALGLHMGAHARPMCATAPDMSPIAISMLFTPVFLNLDFFVTVANGRKHNVYHCNTQFAGMQIGAPECFEHIFTQFS